MFLKAIATAWKLVFRNVRPEPSPLKLTEIVKAHEIKSITVLHMEVPCCGGIANVVKQALINSGKIIPWWIVTIATGGRIVDE
ncbi:MAG: hypothetical protein STSR0004_09960 [Peptococcaceae bacterium]